MLNYFFTSVCKFSETTLLFQWSKCVGLSNGLVFDWWYENQTKNVSFMVKKDRLFNGPPNYLIRLFESRKKCWKSQMFGFQVFGMQMVTVYAITFLISIILVYPLI